jgi:hypothetical protein
MPEPPREHAPWWFTIAERAGAPVALAGAILAARLLWLAFVSPLTLSEDEAHYWLWSQHPGWSYYSKGPGVAWLIAASTALFGDTQFAVRAPAAVATALGTLGAAAATRWAGADRVTAFTSAVLYACIPGLALAGALMTIDAPYAACWMWAGACALHAARTGATMAWLGLGAAVAVGFLFKYTILLILPGVALGVWAARRGPHALRPPLRPGAIAAAAAVASLGLLPVAIWNASHDWATVRHLLGHLHAPGGDTAAGRSWSPWWPIEFAALQFVVCGGVLALAILALVRTPREHPDRAMVRFCIACSLPIFAFYAAVSFLTRTEANWAVAGAATLCPAGAVAVVRAVRGREILGRVCWGLAFFGGVLATIAPGASVRLARAPLLGPYLPVERISGMRLHAADAARRLDELQRATGLDPFVITDHYGRASLLAFYLPKADLSHTGTEFLCASAHLGGRPSQFDHRDETDLANPDTARALAGRPALVIGHPSGDWASLFETLTPIGPLDAEPKPGARTAYLATGFRGIAPVPGPEPRPTPHHPATRKEGHDG